MTEIIEAARGRAAEAARVRASRPWRRAIGGALLVAALGGGYSFYRATAKPVAQVQVLPPATPVSVATLTPRTVRPFAEFSGRIDAIDYAEIRPQVVGRITDIRFHDGQLVKAGDLLFVIDPRPYQAAVAKAQADLATAVNDASLAKVERDRAGQLVKTSAMSRETYDQRTNAEAVAQAAIHSAAAMLAAAQVNLDYAYIKAPISGRISRAEITLGNLVGSLTEPPPLLTSIVSQDGVYADFEVDEQTYLDIVRSYGHAPGWQQRIPVDLVIQGDGARVYHGHMESFDNRIDTASGTIRARARFANEDGSLVPGMFVSVRLGASPLAGALLVPASAVGNDQSKRFVFVVDAGRKAEYRAVQLGAEIGGERVVTAGLKPGDTVILDGLQRLAPGAPVLPQPRPVATVSN